VVAVYSLKTCDLSAPHVGAQVGLDNVTISPLSVNGLVPFSVAMDGLYEKIPGFRRLEYNPEKQKAEIGPLSEPMVIGALIGLLLGIAAGYSLKGVLELCVHIAAVMFLIPVSAGMIAKSFEPISEHLKEMMSRRFHGHRALYFSLHTGVIMGHRSVMATGLILMPVSILLALLIAGTLAPMITELSKEVGVELAEGSLISTFTDGGNPIRFWLYHLYQLQPFALAAVPLVLLLLYIAQRRAASMEAEK